MKHRPPPKELRELWARIPDIPDCKGRCDISCGPIRCSTKERKLVEARAGKKLDAPPPKLTCSMLTANGRCSVYSIRPMVCRLWGTTQAMACPFGCTPERWVPDREALELLSEAARLSGDPEGQMTPEMIANLTEQELSVFHDFVSAHERYSPITRANREVRPPEQLPRSRRTRPN